MQANELRLGNYIKTIDGIGKVNAIAKTYLQLENRQTFTYEDLFGVPLTEEWLFKFGFFKTSGKEGFEIKKGKFTVDEFSNGYYVQGAGEGTYINYVHQLQNIHFALTGQELEI